MRLVADALCFSMGNGVTKGGWFITDVWHLNIIYYLCMRIHLNEVNLHPKVL